MKLRDTAPNEEGEEKAEGSPDLFDYIDGIFRNREIGTRPPLYIIHRFLASDRLYAQVAAELQLRISDDQRLFNTWRALTPDQERSPRLTYPAAGSPDEAEDLLKTLMDRMTLSRTEAEEALQIIDMAGERSGVRAQFGVEP